MGVPVVGLSLAMVEVIKAMMVSIRGIAMGSQCWMLHYLGHQYLL
jgi:hypothetical protein